ncbi:MAG: 3-demethylubiquinone-9 3-methyltransferase [Fibrobacteres bacterium]|nr:3-demethylubiquinone-9 3-methyltransferase [Fibrobacterota bacterium]
MPSNPQRIIPHLWYDKEAKEAAAFYASVFPESKVENATRLEGTPSGDVDLVSFRLWGQKFQAISAGPLFKFNPSISFIVNFDPLFFGKGPSAVKEARDKLDEVWGKLSQGGTALMPLDTYPFSERYGWIQDRFGLSWQLMMGKPDGDPRPPIIPALMFTGPNLGKAKEAIDLYLSVFRDSKPGIMVPYGPGQEPSREGTVMFADFMVEKQWLAAMDSAGEHGFTFNEAVSLMVVCDTQADLDQYWGKLSAVPEAEQCGWLKDKFGVSWQVVPASMNEMLRKGTKEQVARVTQAFLRMKKFDLAALQEAYEGALTP